MHIFFSGIGGTGIGPLAVVAKEAGYDVSGSDLMDSNYIKYLRNYGIHDIEIGQMRHQIEALHAKKPIDWLVYSSAVPKTNPDHPELLFCQEHDIKMTKRDEFLNEILARKQLRLIAVAGTHGKTTTTAMLIWLFKQLREPISYSVGAKIEFGQMGAYDPRSECFVYECDEFDRNFLAFNPYLTVISGIAWDHHEIFPTQDDYNEAFRHFIGQSGKTILWDEDYEKLYEKESDNQQSDQLIVCSGDDPHIEQIKLTGLYNRRDAWLAIKALSELNEHRPGDLITLMNQFPGLSRRFEKITDNLYSDYAHTPEKITGSMDIAREKAQKTNQKIVVIYEPLTNRRMHYTATAHRDLFEGASAIYWVPSYLAREDPRMPLLTPKELIERLNPTLRKIAQSMKLDSLLQDTIEDHLSKGDLVVAMTGGGAGSLDEWLRKEFADENNKY